MNYEIVRQLAAMEAYDPSTEGYYRHVCRFFAKEWNTPLAEVEEYNPDYVLQHFFEHMYEQYDDERLEIEVHKVLDPNFDENEEKLLQDLVQKIKSEKHQSLHKPLTEVSKTFTEEDAPDLAGSGLGTLTPDPK